MALSEYSKRLLGAYAEQPFLMAPMAGVTDPAYRIMCRRRGAHLAYSEMVSVAGLAYASNKTWRLVLPADEEQQICVQLFGSKPDQFASAVAAVEERVGDRLSLIDINMACPARKVVTKGEGSALMRTPDLAEQIVEAAVGAAHVPVTVKIRKGFYAEDRNAATFAQMLEGAGAAAVAVHGRCATQLYTGQADWSVVDEVADAVEIPVIGSGDVFTAEDAAEHLRSSGASAVFIARGIYGNPWVFGDARALALDGTPVPSRSSVERLEALRAEHAQQVTRLADEAAAERQRLLEEIRLEQERAGGERELLMRQTDSLRQDHVAAVEELRQRVAKLDGVLVSQRQKNQEAEQRASALAASRQQLEETVAAAERRSAGLEDELARLRARQVTDAARLGGQETQISMLMQQLGRESQRAVAAEERLQALMLKPPAAPSPLPAAAGPDAPEGGA